MELTANAQAIAYLVSAILFILALKGLTHPATARRGNFFGIAGMLIAVAATLLGTEVKDYGFIIARAQLRRHGRLARGHRHLHQQGRGR